MNIFSTILKAITTNSIRKWNKNWIKKEKIKKKKNSDEGGFPINEEES